MKRRIALLAMCVAALAVMVLCAGCAQIKEVAQQVTTASYEPTLPDPVVTSPAIAQDGVLRVGVNSANAPYAAQTSGRLAGIDVDVAAALATRMGLTLELVDVGSDAEGALKQGSVDVVMSMDTADTAATCWISDSYINTCVALFSKNETPGLPSDKQNVSIEAQSASMSAWEVSNQFGDSALKAAPDLKTAFADLENGTIDYVASDALIGVYLTHTQHGSAKIAGLLQKVGGRSVGVTTTNDQLKSAITTALEQIKQDGTVSVIEQKWLGTSLDLSTYPQSAAAQKASSQSSQNTSQSSASQNAAPNESTSRRSDSTTEERQSLTSEESSSERTDSVTE